MKKSILLCLAVISIFISYNCRKSIPQPDFSDVKLNLPLSPYNYKTVTSGTTSQTTPVMYENGTQINNLKATIGRVLFYDKALSINNSVSCASCHIQENAFADVSSFSKGFKEGLTTRNSMGISNLIDEVGIGYFWDARESKIESMVFGPIANHIEMGFERIDLIAEKVNNLPYYKKLFKDCYGTEQVTAQRMRESLGQFLFSIVSVSSRFDAGTQNNFLNFTSSELRGKNLFQSKMCASCHFITNTFQSSYGSNGIKFANIGLDIEDKDKGINGAYKIPRLKNISRTAPYMHDGRFKTLEEVINHYSEGIQPNPKLHGFLVETTGGGNTKPRQFRFTAQEKADLIAFLKTLDDNVVTSDIKFSSPFID